MAGQAIFITFLKFSLLYPLNIFDIILSPLCFSLGIIVDLRIDYYNVLCCKKTMHVHSLFPQIQKGRSGGIVLFSEKVFLLKAPSALYIGV